MKFEMKVSPKIIITLEGSTEAELFEQISSVQEVFGQSMCQRCQSDNFRFITRVVEDNKYYEMHCQNPGCRARLSFGQNKKGGTLYPKLKDTEGNYKNNSGWGKFNKETGREE